MATQQRVAHIQGLEDNVSQVKRLLEIHKTLGGTGPGRRSNLEVLNKSGVVLLVACWEAYVEDLATASFDFLFQQAKDPSVFPAGVLTLASKPLRVAADERKVWDLAGEGWRSVLQDHRESILDEYIGRLNTPKPEQVTGLFDKLVGFPNLKSHWRWRGMSCDSSCEKLDRLVELRGSIAHRVAAAESITKPDVENHMWFLYRLAVTSSNRLRDYLQSRTGKYPWTSYIFRRTR
jgi:hypothetical protein